MLIGVPTETVAGERRVALVPEIAGRLTKAGAAVVVQRGAGEQAGFLDRAYEDAGATLADDAAAVYAQADAIVKVQKPADWEVDLMREGTTLIAFLSPLGDPHSVERYARKRIRALSMDADPPHQPRAKYGRVVVAGQRRRLQGGADRGEHAAEVLPDAHDGRGHDPAGESTDHRRRRRRPAGDRHRAPARRRRLGVRHARRRQGTGPQPRRHVPRDRPRRRRRGRGRLRQRAERRANRQAARVHGQSTSARRTASSPPRPSPAAARRCYHRGGRAGDAARQRDRRPGRRDRRQLRADGAGRDRGAARRHDRRHDQPARDDAVRREPPLLAQRLYAAAALDEGRRPGVRRQRRDHARHDVDARRRDHAQAHARALAETPA